MSNGWFRFCILNHVGSRCPNHKSWSPAHRGCQQVAVSPSSHSARLFASHTMAFWPWKFKRSWNIFAQPTYWRNQWSAAVPLVGSSKQIVVDFVLSFPKKDGQINLCYKNHQSVMHGSASKRPHNSRHWRSVRSVQQVPRGPRWGLDRANSRSGAVVVLGFQEKLKSFWKELWKPKKVKSCSETSKNDPKGRCDTTDSQLPRSTRRLWETQIRPHFLSKLAIFRQIGSESSSITAY